MPLGKAHLIRVFTQYEAMLRQGSFEQLDHELFEETWRPSAGLLSSDELSEVGPLIVSFELAVANRDRQRASQALEQAWAWVRERGH